MTASHPTTFLPMAAGYAKLVGHHRHLLDDRVRTQAFLDAIARVVRPGDRVADLGTGTGILALAASRAGARQVWAIDHDPIVRVAARIARDNAISNITFLETHANAVELPEPIDVLVSECFGPLAIGGSMIRAVTELRARTLAPGGRVIPRAVTISLAAVDAPEVYRYVSAFADARYGFAWSAAHVLAMNNVYNTTFEPAAIAATADLATIDLETATWSGAFEAACRLVPDRSGSIHGFAGWFRADLGAGVTLDTSPLAPPTIWRQLFFPLPSPLEVSPSSPIHVELRHRGEHFDWSGAAGDTRFTCSTRYSYPD